MKKELQMENTYSRLIQKMKDGEILNDSDMKFIDSYQKYIKSLSNVLTKGHLGSKFD